MNKNGYDDAVSAVRSKLAGLSDGELRTVVGKIGGSLDADPARLARLTSDVGRLRAMIGPISDSQMRDLIHKTERASGEPVSVQRGRSGRGARVRTRT